MDAGQFLTEYVEEHSLRISKDGLLRKGRNYPSVDVFKTTLTLDAVKKGVVFSDGLNHSSLYKMLLNFLNDKNKEREALEKQESMPMALADAVAMFGPFIKESNEEFLMKNRFLLCKKTGTTYSQNLDTQTVTEIANSVFLMAYNKACPEVRQALGNQVKPLLLSFYFQPWTKKTGLIEGTAKFNFFLGFPFELKTYTKEMDDNLIHFKRLLRILFKNDKDITLAMTWVNNCFHRKNRKALVLRGRTGIGKTLFQSFLAPLFGAYALTSNAEKASGRFNSQFKNKVFVFLDEFEMNDRKNKPLNADILKELTADFFSFEKKGVNSSETSENNYMSVILANNAKEAENTFKLNLDENGVSDERRILMPDLNNYLEKNDGDDEISRVRIELRAIGEFFQSVKPELVDGEFIFPNENFFHALRSFIAKFDNFEILEEVCTSETYLETIYKSLKSWQLYACERLRELKIITFNCLYSEIEKKMSRKNFMPTKESVFRFLKVYKYPSKPLNFFKLESADPTAHAKNLEGEQYLESLQIHLNT